MTESIEWQERGPITFHDLGDEPIVLRVPRIGEVWDFQDGLTDSLAGYMEEMEKLRAEVEAEGEGTLPDELAARVKDFNRAGALRAFEGWYRDVFKRLGNASLPKDIRQWPSYMLEYALPVKMRDHWQDNPKASGETPTE